MKALIFVLLGMAGTATNSLAADCTTAATQAGTVATLQSDVYYHCAQMDTTFESKQNDYIVNFSCVGETGSGVLSYRITFVDSTCTNPIVTDISTN
jgi:hypothetical protein